VLPTRREVQRAVPADILKVVIRWFVEEVLNTGNLAAVDELFDPDYVAHIPLDSEPLRGVAAWKQRTTTYLAAFPDLHVTLEDLVAEGDIVVARLTWSGTQREVFLGASATNRRVAVAGVYAWRIAGGKIREEWIAEDLLSLMQQLGAVPKSLPR
jgi:steroid delta-isomerase-like uncharacterized protein